MAVPSQKAVEQSAPVAKPAETAPAGKNVIAPGALSAMTLKQEAWRRNLRQVPLPRKGCFTAVYPKTEWKEERCVRAPNRPQPPARGGNPNIVGNGVDWSAEVTSGTISASTGSFASVSGLTSETNSSGGSNTYTLQLNTNFFASTACAPSPNPACQGWEQFVYENTGVAFIQYWLLRYNTTCPGGWNTYSFSGSTDIYCYRNATNAVSVPVQALSNFPNLTLTGMANAGGDSVTLFDGTTAHTAAGDNSVNAHGGWTEAEYNVVGDCCATQANFNGGTTIVVRTAVDNSTLNAPSCALAGFTGETNNLTLSGGPSVIPVMHEPRIEFTETNSAITPQTCATSIGDTHLATFNGLFYDFQASGDFLLAQGGSDFTVQTRQVSGAPNWPNAAVNKAVATRMGNARVAICSGPTRVFVNGTATGVADGQSISLGGGVSLYHGGDTWLIWRKGGDSVRVRVNTIPGNTWMDVAVGMPRSANPRGLVANPNGNVAVLAMRNGQQLAAPVSFNDLYHRYAESWRVQPNENLLASCGGQIALGIPARAFFAADLPRQAFDKAHALCAGVEGAAAQEACTLDAAVLGHKAATRVYARPLAITAVLRPNLQLERIKAIGIVRPPLQKAPVKNVEPR